MCSLIHLHRPGRSHYLYVRPRKPLGDAQPCRSPPCPHGLQTHGHEPHSSCTILKFFAHQLVLWETTLETCLHVYLPTRMYWVNSATPRITHSTHYIGPAVSMFGAFSNWRTHKQISFPRLAPQALLPIQHISRNSQTLYIYPTRPPPSLTDKV